MNQRWQTRLGMLVVALCVVVSVLSCNPNLSLRSVVFGYGGGGGGSSVGAGAYTDVVPPQISNIEVAVSANGSTITWTTDKSSISWVVYGLDADYGSEVKTTSYVTSHAVILGDLIPGTTYHYGVKSKDSSGSIGVYTDKIFTILGEGELVIEEEEEEEVFEEIPEEIPEKPISEMTVGELRSKIAEISAKIADLQTYLIEIAGERVKVQKDIPAGFTFEAPLELGMSNNECKYLQMVLNSDSATKLAESGVGSHGSETSYFGPLTKSAVVKFQEKYADEILAPWGLIAGTGFVGSTTRAKLNTLLVAAQ